MTWILCRGILIICYKLCCGEYVERKRKKITSWRLTKAGVRVLLIKKDVEECFRKIINNRPHLKVEPIIDGIAASFILIKIKILWFHFIGKNISNTSVRSIIGCTSCKCQRLLHTFAVIPTALTWLGVA